MGGRSGTTTQPCTTRDGSRPVDVSHDGSVVLTEGGAILDAATGSMRHRLPVGDVTTAMFADRGAIVLIFLEQRTDHYDSVTGQLVARSGPTGEFQVAASSASRFGRVLPSLSPDERSIAAANEHGAVAVVDVRSGTTHDVDVDGSATSVAWIGTDRLVVGFSDGAVRIVSSSDGQPIGAPLAGLNGPVYGIAADPDGERVFGFDTQREVRGIEWLLLGGRRVVWDVASGGLLQVDDDTTIVRGMRHVPTGGAWRLQGGRWSYMPDDDDVLACREALSIAGDALVDLLGHPSVCTTVPELGG